MDEHLKSCCCPLAALQRHSLLPLAFDPVHPCRIVAPPSALLRDDASGLVGRTGWTRLSYPRQLQLQPRKNCAEGNACQVEEQFPYISSLHPLNFHPSHSARQVTTRSTSACSLRRYAATAYGANWTGDKSTKAPHPVTA